MPVAIQQITDLKSKVHFVAGVRFEIYFALMALLTEHNGVHLPWQREAVEKLPDDFLSRAVSVAGSPEMWPVVADVLDTAHPGLTFEDMMDQIEAMPIKQLQTSILEGGLHDQALVSDLLSGIRGLESVTDDLPELEQKWFGFLGLHPYDASRPTPKALTRLIEQPESYRSELVSLLREFWNRVFRETWAAIEPRVQLSLADKQRLFEIMPPSEFARQVLTRIEIDNDSFDITCSCSGHPISIDDVDAIYVVPSAFNDKRMWSLYPNEKTTLFVPYFDASISVAVQPTAPFASDLSPALIFKALGEPTRYELARLIAAKPRTSAELARMMSVSKPTITHHVQHLRSAGLIGEDATGAGVRLSLKKEVIARLSDAALADFK